MEVKVRNEKISFSIKLTSKYTFIRGESGVGKSTFVLALNNPDSIINSPLSLIALPVNFTNVTSFKEVLQGLAGKNNKVIFYGDEDLDYIYSRQFQAVMLKMEYMFIIVCREPFHSIPYGSKDVYTFKNTGGHHEAVSLYEPLPPADINLFNKIITEDSGSGYHFFKQVYANIASSNGKTNFKDLIETNRNTLFIADELGIGNVYADIKDALQKNTTNQLLLIDSFEAMLLQSKWLDSWEEPDLFCPNKEKYATQLLQSTLKTGGIGYTKTKLSDCLLKDCCFKKEKCRFATTRDKIDLVCESTGVDFPKRKPIPLVNTLRDITHTTSATEIKALINSIPQTDKDKYKWVNWNDTNAVRLAAVSILALS